MNRQQRRLNARRIAQERQFEQKYWRDIVERQNQVDDRQLGINMVCLGLALNKLYGWQAHGIENVIREYNAQICRLADDESYEDLARELKDKTGIEIRLVNSGEEQ